MKGKPLTTTKAKTILKDGEVKGHPLTQKQRGYFGAIADGNSTKKPKGK